MKYKSTLKYQLINMRAPVFTFYLVLLCIQAFLFISSSIMVGSFPSRVTFTGMGFATVIFLFIFGLNSFKEFFRMFMQNGISRKTIFTSRIITILTVCTGMAVIDTILLILGKWVASMDMRITYTGIFEMIYSGRVNQISTLQMHSEGFLFNLCLYLVAMIVGYFITIGFYRMNKAAKIAVAIGVPTILLNGLPILDVALLHGVIMKALYNAVSFAFGFQNGDNPYFGVVTLLLISAVFVRLSWLMVRRAVIKD